MLILRVDPLRPDPEKIRAAAEAIRAGGLVAFPTETVYGLGADAFNGEASAKIFKVKGRPADNPLIVHVRGVDQAQEIGDIPAGALEVMERVWPGPITFVVKKKANLPDVVTAGLPTVALRCPAHPTALKLIELSGTAIAAPSANKAGRPSPTRAEHVVEDLGEAVDVVLDAGPTFFGVESTIIDVTRGRPVLLRPGPFTAEEIKAIFGDVEIPAFARGLGEAEVALAPGMKYRHYAPDTPLLLAEDLGEAAAYLRSRGLRVAVLCALDKCADGDAVLRLGSEPYEVAKNLYDALRTVDRLGVDVAIGPVLEERGIGLAVMNRLRKAAGFRVAKDIKDLEKYASELARRVLR
ncbi:MAG: L-threonylcarbamoyladenylate synthase [Thermoproteus sp. AZ2]|uniref:L-threonylcarbamoyladenylate synthase n=1 Tax=Thermoproteus sp. AZ2 TaxID=1609232 RepID=A0ACC6UY81_9CREN